MFTPNPILQNLTGVIFLMDAEVGCYLQNYGRTTKRDRTNVFDVSVGYSTGFYSIEPQANYKIKGRTSGSTGIPAAAPAVALTLANPTTGNGVDAGGIYTDTAGLDHAEKQLQEINVDATQMPGIA